MNNNIYTLQKLPYSFNELEPYLSAEQTRIHYEKHHFSYVKNLNNLILLLNEARKTNAEINLKAIAKEISYNFGGHLLHSLFWQILSSPKEEGGGNPHGLIKEMIEKEFETFERFKHEFSKIASSTEGSGWAALSYCQKTNHLLITQIEKHNMNIAPEMPILLALDMFEHAYYIDYKNEKEKYINSFWNLIDWNEINVLAEKYSKI